MTQTIYQVDAFASAPFTGNPAAVCLLPAPAAETWMQQVAMEMNVAETAFLIRQEGGYGLRWFTPTIEVDLCGHATIAASHALWEMGEEPADSTIVFHTKSGILKATKSDGCIELDFPAEPDTECDAPAGLLEALGVERDDLNHVGRNRFDLLVELESADSLRRLMPNTVALANVDCRGVIVTAVSDQNDADFISRFFAPAAGIAEDPVTGSAHCCLAPYWRARLGKDRMVGYQASQRGGYVRVQVVGDRVLLGGQAVTTMRGELQC